MKKRLARILAVTLGAATLLTGCGGNSGQKTSDSSKKSDDQKITEDVTKTEGEIEVWKNLSQEEMNFYVEEFNKIVPGVKVKVTVMPSKEYRTKLQNAFRTGTNAPDVATFEISDLGVYKETDMLENLSQEKYGAEDISKDMIPYVDELSRDKEGDIRGLSWQSTPGGFWYKKALAKEYLGTDDPDELAAMLSDWDKIVEVGKQVYEKSDGKIALLDDVESVLQLYVSYKGQPWVDDNNHIISDDYMLEMYKMMETVVSNKVDAEADMWSAGWTSGMYSKDMFILTCLPTWGLNFCIKPGIPDDEMDKAANTWGYMQAPIPYQNGGTWYTECDDWLEQVNIYLEENYNFLAKYLQKHMPELEVIPSEGTYMAWIKTSKLGISPKALEQFFIEKAKVSVYMGDRYGKHTEEFIRVNIATSREYLEKALHRVKVHYDESVQGR